MQGLQPLGRDRAWVDLNGILAARHEALRNEVTQVLRAIGQLDLAISLAYVFFLGIVGAMLSGISMANYHVLQGRG